MRKTNLSTPVQYQDDSPSEDYYYFNDYESDIPYKEPSKDEIIEEKNREIANLRSENRQNSISANRRETYLFVSIIIIFLLLIYSAKESGRSIERCENIISKVRSIILRSKAFEDAPYHLKSYIEDNEREREVDCDPEAGPDNY